ncbi:MAG: acyloxyacyl hydrolase [Desulfobacterales bacterium]|nr:acyloxyacyl hydrolase [Desulfobacterales bacterium]
MSRYNLIMCFILYLLLSYSALQAQEDNHTELPKNILLEAEYYDAVDSDRQIFTYNVNAGIGFYPFKNLGLFGVLVLSGNEGYSTDDFKPYLGKMNADSSGLGITAMARLHLLKTDSFGLFFDASSGGIYYDDEFPPQGTHWNYMSRCGGGITWQINKKTALGIGYRYMHISNGKMDDSDNNPAMDSKGGFIGIVYEF